MQVAIIGAGAAGLFAAGLLSQQGHSVTIFDGNDKCGKKLYITGKGRCNLTNDCDVPTFLQHVVHGDKFLRSAITRFTPQDCQAFFDSQGLALKIERGNRVFPASDKASDVTKILQQFCRSCRFKLANPVKSIGIEKETAGSTMMEQKVQFKVKTASETLCFDKVFIATGGKSYPATGSTGDGYRFAKQFGHTIVAPAPALVPIQLKDTFVHDLEGVSLKNVTLTAIADGKEIKQFGEMLFTSDGISGPIVLTMSSYINRSEKVQLSLDLKPALTEVQLDARLLREFETAKNRNVGNVLRTLLPQALVPIFLQVANISDEKKIHSVTVSDRKSIIALLKAFPLTYKKLYPIEAAVVTAGGVNLKEIDPKTMESKLQKGLYFIGEVLDVDALTGGFNLQIAFSTAYAAAIAMK